MVDAEDAGQAAALRRALTDDALVDAAAVANEAVVRSATRRRAAQATDGQRVLRRGQLMRFAVVSHIVPPSWSGQAVTLGKIITGDLAERCAFSVKTNCPVAVSNVLVRRSALGPDAFAPVKIGEDVLLWVRLVRALPS
jgi:hypothetical protein